MLVPNKAIIDGLDVKITEYKCSKCNSCWDSSIREGLSYISYCGQCSFNFDFNELKNREWAFKLELLHKLEKVGLTKIAVDLTKKYCEDIKLFTDEKEKVEEPKIAPPKHVSFGFGQCDYAHCILQINLTEDQYKLLYLMYNNKNSIILSVCKGFDNAYKFLDSNGIFSVGLSPGLNYDCESKVKVPCWVSPCADGTVKLLVFREKNKIDSNPCGEIVLTKMKPCALDPVQVSLNSLSLGELCILRKIYDGAKWEKLLKCFGYEKIIDNLKKRGTMELLSIVHDLSENLPENGKKNVKGREARGR